MRLTASRVARLAKKKRNLSTAASVSAIRGHTETQKNPGWHSKAQEGAPIDDRFTAVGVQAELDSFQNAADAAPCHANGIAGATDNGVNSWRDHLTGGRLRRKVVFKDQTRRLDNGSDEILHPKSPDVERHEVAKSKRWIDCWSSSQCVTGALESNIPVKRSDAGSFDSNRSSYGEEGGTGGIFAANRTTIPRQHDVVSQTALMSQHVKCGKGRQALRIYKEMQRAGLTFSSYTYVAALQACSSLKDLESARQIHAEVVESGLELDVYVGTMLVDVYGKCGSLVEARGVFDKMHRRTVVSWNSLILGYAQVEQGDDAVQLYEQMQQEGVVPNDRTFVAVLKACSNRLASGQGSNAQWILVKKRCLDQVRAIHSLALTSGFESDIFVGTMLVDVYAKCGSLVDARRVFDRMPLRNVVTWTAIISGHSQMGEGKEALQLFAQMQKEGVVPDDRTFVGALKACSSLAASEEGNEADRNSRKTWCLEQVRTIHTQVVRSGCEDIFVGNMMVDVYAKCGSLVDARDVFEKMSHRNVVSWTAMILGYALLEEGDVALQLYAQMQQEGIVPNERTFIGALKACGSMALLEKGKEIHAQISKTRPADTDLFVASGLIDMYCKCGSMGDAQQVFDASGSRDVVAWNALITGYARQGESQPVFDLFEMMRQEGIQPDGLTFLGLLTLCSHVGLVDKGKSYFDAMTRDFGLIPSIEHYNCMIDLLSRAGQLGQAMELVKTMPFPPSGEVWRSLLGACRKWKNVELGQTAFECAMRFNKADPAAFVLLSNIYAGSHMLEDAQEVHVKRLRSQAWKQPGLSWLTDTGGLPHTFLVGDREHPESHCIYAELCDLCVKMEEVNVTQAD